MYLEANFKRMMIDHAKKRTLETEVFGFHFHEKLLELKLAYYMLLYHNQSSMITMTTPRQYNVIKVIKAYNPDMISALGAEIAVLQLTDHFHLNLPYGFEFDTAVLRGDLEDKVFDTLRDKLGYDTIKLPDAAKKKAWGKFRTRIKYIAE